jgi:uncharacterized membrane protein
MLKRFAIALAGFVVLDGIWLGVLMKGFYRGQLAAIARMKDGGFAPIWAAVAPVYVLLAIGVVVFVVPRAADVWSAAKYAALFGLVVYGVYDLTNYSTLTQYPLSITVVDICWGTFATAACAAAVKALA